MARPGKPRRDQPRADLRGTGQRADLSRTNQRSGKRRASQPDAGQAQTSRPARPFASEALLADLRNAAIEQAGALRTGADWLRLLRFAEHFREYGGLNALLILRDRPYATRLATYDEWKTGGHQIQRGEHGITLFNPTDPRDTQRVFDITQTGQPPAPGPLRHLRPARHSANALRSALTTFAMRKGFDVLNDSPDVPARTAFSEGTIHLHPDLSPDAACYALAHELAHVLVHTSDRLDPATGACDSIGLIEAESVAYILCRNAGLDVTPFTFPDPTTWAGADPRSNTGATLLPAIERITTTAHRLITQVDETDPASSPAPEPTTQKSRPVTKADRPGPTQQAVRTAEPQPDPRLVAIHQDAEQFFTSRLPGSWVPGYLAVRGLAAALDENAPWSIGYAPAGWTALVGHLQANGYTDEEIITSGLGKRSRTGGLIDRFRDRAMIPVRDPGSTTIAFIGRANPDTPSTGEHPVPKYLNSPRTPLYTKGTVLYGLDQALPRLRAGAIPVLVEGTLDAIAIHLADPDRRYAPIAPSGTALTAEQVNGLKHAVDLHERGVLVAFDGDPAGQRAATRAHRLLHPYADRLQHARLAAGDDPAGLLENHGPDHLLTALSNRRPLAGAVLDEHLDTTRDQPETQRRDQAAHLIAELAPPDTIRRLAAANIPPPDSPPENSGPPPVTAIVDLLPYVTKDLILHAANAIGTTITDQINAVVTAADERASKVPERPGDPAQDSTPSELAARDGPPQPLIPGNGGFTPSTPAPQSPRPSARTR